MSDQEEFQEHQEASEEQQFDESETNEMAPPKDVSIETNWGEYAEKFGVREVVERFEEMGLHPELLHGIFTYGFESPSSIQQRGINAINTGKHLIAQAQSGTGKTATFCVGTLNKIDLDLPQTQVLVLAPTRELATQIFDVYEHIGVHLKKLGLRTMACVGGTLVEEDKRKLQNGIHVVVGTPGRVKHLVDIKALSLSALKCFVLDEADEMLSRGFQEQIYEILREVDHTFQICLFSATLEADTLEIADKFMEDPIMILVKKEEVTLEGIKQYFVALREDWKLDILTDLYKSLRINQCIIYCNSKKKVEWLARRMGEEDHAVTFMHGDMDDATRKRIMGDFRSGTSRVLITTDLNSRGIDVHGVSLVINYDVPKQKETYVHRIGRSGRFGRKGMAINFVVGDGEEDVQMMKDIEKYYSTEIDELKTEDIREGATNKK